MTDRYESSRALGSIGDTVFSDNSGDGIFNPGVDTPLANVTVQLYDLNGNLVDEQVTNSNGNYLFADIETDPYIVKVVVSTLPPENRAYPNYDYDFGNDNQALVEIFDDFPNDYDADFSYGVGVPTAVDLQTADLDAPSILLPIAVGFGMLLLATHRLKARLIPVEAS